MREAARAIDRPRNVAIAGRVFREQDVARPESMSRAVRQLDFADARGDEDELALRRAVLRMHVRGRRIAKKEAQRRQIGGSRAAACIRFHGNCAPLDARASVVVSEYAGHDHAGYYGPSHLRSNSPGRLQRWSK